MDRWGIVIFVFVFAWVLQVVLSYFQQRHYGLTIHNMCEQYKTGYLGVGVVKKRFGIGSVVILVSDVAGVIVAAKEMTGVTVFSRFRPIDEFAGKHMDELVLNSTTDYRSQAVQLAAVRLMQQKQQGGE
jgi:glucitol operon activator protein